MSDENTNLDTIEEPTAGTTQETETTSSTPATEPPAATPAPDDTARGKSSREARYRLRAKEAETKAEEQEKQITELQAQLKAQQEAYEQEKAAAARAALCSELDKKCFCKDRGFFAMMEGLPDDTLKAIAHELWLYEWGKINETATKHPDESQFRRGPGWNQAF